MVSYDLSLKDPALQTHGITYYFPEKGPQACDPHRLCPPFSAPKLFIHPSRCHLPSLLVSSLPPTAPFIGIFFSLSLPSQNLPASRTPEALPASLSIFHCTVMVYPTGPWRLE